MAFLKRPEVWLLLLLSVAGIGYVLWSDQKRDDQETGNEASPSAGTSQGEDENPRFVIAERRVSREADHLILTITVSLVGPFEDSGASELSAEAGTIQLLSGEGVSLPRFFLPFDPPPILENRAGASIDLRFWIPTAQADGELWLTWEGEKLPVKHTSTDPDWIEPFPEGVEVAVIGPGWTPRT